MGQLDGRIALVTGGGRGSVCHQRQGAAIVSSSVPLVPGERTVDTTGCGDAYVAGFLYGYLKGEPGLVCGRLGATLASFVVEARGCCTAMPTPEQFWQRYTHHFQEEPPR